MNKKIIKAKIAFRQVHTKLKPVLNEKLVKVPKIPSVDQPYKQNKEINVRERSKQNNAQNLPKKLTDFLNRKFVGDIPVVLKDYGVYVKETEVDYDVVICVTSYERYNKIRRILKQLHTQETKYTFKFIVLNDASFDKNYDNLPIEFPNIIYMKNDENGGKENYWKTVNKLWSEGKKYRCHAFLQIDDDFILCEYFLDRLLDEFFKKKVEDNRFMVFSYHMYGYKKDEPLANWWYNGISIAIDGGTMFDNRFLKLFNHYVNIGERYVAAHTSTFFWDTIVQHIRDLGVRVYRMPKSMAWHDGNYDSKLNYVARLSKKSYTKGFIDGEDKYDTDKDLSDIQFN